MDSEQEMNAGVKVVCAVLLVAVVTAAGVGLLVQHRKLDEQRRARASLENANQQLVASREELVSANGKLADELRGLRDSVRKHAADWATAEKERASWKSERESLAGRVAAWKDTLSVLSNRVAEAAAEVTEARAAQARAEKEVAGLRASVKDLKASLKKIRAERDRLERELNEAMQPAEESDAPVPAPAPATAPTLAPVSAPDDNDNLVPVIPAPPLDKRTPEERKAHEKEELNDLMQL